MAEPPKREFPLTEKVVEGDVVPIPTLPLTPDTYMKGVLVPWSATTNIGVVELESPWIDSTDRIPHGVEVPTPTVDVEVREPSASAFAVDEPYEMNPACSCRVVEVAA